MNHNQSYQFATLRSWFSDIGSVCRFHNSKSYCGRIMPTRDKSWWSWILGSPLEFEPQRQGFKARKCWIWVLQTNTFRWNVPQQIWGCCFLSAKTLFLIFGISLGLAYHGSHESLWRGAHSGCTSWASKHLCQKASESQITKMGMPQNRGFQY